MEKNRVETLNRNRNAKEASRTSPETEDTCTLWPNSVKKAAVEESVEPGMKEMRLEQVCILIADFLEAASSAAAPVEREVWLAYESARV